MDYMDHICTHIYERGCTDVEVLSDLLYNIEIIM